MQTSTDLRRRMFKIIVQIIAILSVFCIIGNILFGFPLKLNIKWIIIGVFSLFLLNHKKVHEENHIYPMLYFLCIILILLPYGWTESGGSNNNGIAYVFLGMIMITFLFEGKRRIFLIATLITMFMMMICIEYFYPQVIQMHDPQTQFLDRLIQIPLTLTGGFLLLKRFADAYMKEREALDGYSKELQIANEKLEFMANRDVLTKAYNRRLFDAQLEEIITNEKAVTEEIYMVLFDADYFKQINDTYGHSAGDQVICQLAAYAEDILPKSSLMARWGGDEFAILFFGTLDEVRTYMDSFNQRIGKIKANGMHITISAGITRIQASDTMQEVFIRVDKALYQSKQQGRNQYTIM